MSISALIAPVNLNCFALKPKQTKVPPAPAVIRALNEYSPLSPLSPRAVKEHLLRLAGALPATHARPQVAQPANPSSFGETLKKPQLIFKHLPQLVSSNG
jgi:hypothetical protein